MLQKLKFFFQRPKHAVVISAMVLAIVLGLSASAYAGNGQGNNGNGNGNSGPKKTPGLALIAVAGLSSISYAGYRHFLKRKEK